MSDNDFAWVAYLELFPLAMAYRMQFLIKSCGQGRYIISCFLSYNLFMGTYLPTKEPWFHANTSFKSPKASVENYLAVAQKRNICRLQWKLIFSVSLIKFENCPPFFFPINLGNLCPISDRINELILMQEIFERLLGKLTKLQFSHNVMRWGGCISCYSIITLPQRSLRRQSLTRVFQYWSCISLVMIWFGADIG